MFGGGRRLAGAVAVAIAACLGSAAAAYATEPVKAPVILVHGWGGSSAAMSAMKEAFVAAGYPTYAIDLPGQDNIVNGARIADLVRDVRAQTGAEKVSLVTHSMGGLSARYYLKRLGGVAVVQAYVSMGTSQYGYLPSCLLGEYDGGQMCPGSAFLRDLNAGDDTPGDVTYATFRSSQESAQGTRLDGGACFAVPGAVDHRDEPATPAFIDAALAVVGGSCPGTVKNLPY